MIHFFIFISRIIDPILTTLTYLFCLHKSIYFRNDFLVKLMLFEGIPDTIHNCTVAITIYQRMR